METFQEDSLSSGSSLKLSDDSGIEDSWLDTDENGSSKKRYEDQQNVMLDTDLSKALQGVELPAGNALCNLSTNDLIVKSIEVSHSSLSPLPLALPAIGCSRYGDVEDDSATPYVCGLHNIGNTCFMNAAFQCFLVSPLASILLQEDNQITKHSHSIIHSNQVLVKKKLKDILEKQMSGRYRTVSTREFHDALWKCESPFTDFKQHDCQEFISYLLNLIHDVMKETIDRKIEDEGDTSTSDEQYEEHRKRRRIDNETTEADAGVECEDALQEADVAWKKHMTSNRSPICSNFQGQFKSTVTCEKCNHSSHAYETFMSLSLPIPHALERQVAVTWIPMMSAADLQPIRYLLVVKKLATVKDLHIALNKKLSLQNKIEDVIFVEVSNNAVYRFLGESMSLKFVDLTKHEVYAFHQPLPVSEQMEVQSDPSYPKTPATCSDLPAAADMSSVDDARTFAKPQSNGLVWHSCTICLEEMFDDELLVHQPCGGALCDPCFQATANYHNNTSFSCPVCSVVVNPSDFAKSVETPSASARTVTVSRLLRCPATQGLAGWKSKNSICGLPALVRTSCISDYATLKQMVEETLPSTILASQWQLAITDASGLMCSRCDPIAGCFGCVLTPDEEVRLKAGDSIVVHIQTEEAFNEDQSIVDDVSMTTKRDSNAVCLEECVDAFTQTEFLGTDNPWHCTSCKQNRTATKTLTIARIPNTLIVHLKRFYFDENVSKKITNPVVFPLENLVISTTSLLAADEQKDEANYELMGFVNHSGSLIGGHYTSRTRNPLTKEWHLYSDDVITQGCTTEDDMEKVYLLLYERKDPTA